MPDKGGNQPQPPPADKPLSFPQAPCRKPDVPKTNRQSIADRSENSELAAKRLINYIAGQDPWNPVGSNRNASGSGSSDPTSGNKTKT